MASPFADKTGKCTYSFSPSLQAITPLYANCAEVTPPPVPDIHLTPDGRDSVIVPFMPIVTSITGVSGSGCEPGDPPITAGNEPYIRDFYFSGSTLMAQRYVPKFDDCGFEYGAHVPFGADVDILGPYVVNAKIITDLRIDTATMYFEYKYRTLTLPAAWLSPESDWTLYHAGTSCVLLT